MNLNYRVDMKKVTKEEFFKVIYEGNLNVHPTIVNEWDETHGVGYISEWKNLSTRQLFGITESGVFPKTESHYYLASQ